MYVGEKIEYDVFKMRLIIWSFTSAKSIDKLMSNLAPEDNSHKVTMREANMARDNVHFGHFNRAHILYNFDGCLS